MTYAKESSTPYPEIQLSTVQTTDGRNIAFATAGPNSVLTPPILLFYPGGGNRRMLLTTQKALPDSRLLCVNRPGKGETSRPASGRVDVILDTAVRDVVVVLDSLNIDRVSILSMCAGTPFAMAFAIQHKERITGYWMGISSWVQPADCGWKHSKTTYRIVSHAPGFFSPIVGSVMRSMGTSFTSFPTSWVKSALRSRLSKIEYDAFDEAFKDEKDFSSVMEYIQAETGGQGYDTKVLFSKDLIDYEQMGENLPNIQLWHGTRDSTVPYASVQWLEEQLPNAKLNTITDGSHDGCNFLLHSTIRDALKTFAQEGATL